MKKLIAVALAVCLAATPALAVVDDNTPITQKEVAARAQVCVSLAKREITPAQVVQALGLDTQRKQRDFALQCYMLMFGVEAASGTSV